MESSRDDRQGAELLRHAVWIRRLALGLVGDAAQADDLVQDTWLAALRRPPSADRPLRPWLGTVLRNAARQAFRGHRRRTERQHEAREPAPVAGPDELAERLEAERRMTDELARLAEPYRSTLLLRYYEGLEPSEIASRLGLPAGTVRWRLKHGLDELRGRLDERFGERAQWSALVLSLARPDGWPWSGAAAGAAAVTVPGALTMHALTKFGIGAAAVVALAIGLRLGGVLPDEVWPLAGEKPLELAMRPIRPPLEDVEPARAAVVEAGEREPLRAEPAPRPAAEPTASAAAPTSAIVARALDELGAPIARARLRLLDARQPLSAVSDRQGNLRLDLPAAGGRRTAALALSAPGCASRGIEAVVTPGETTHLGALVLAPGGALSGTVRASDGRWLGNAQVTLSSTEEPARQELESQRLRPPDARVPEAFTRADGGFDLEGAPTGFVRVWAHAAGYMASFSAPVEVRAGQETYGIELVLEPLAAANRIAGIVLDPEGAPVPGARLDYRHSSKKSGVTTAGDHETDARGRFEFLVPADTELWLTAHDPEERYGPGSASGVKTGSGELVVRLTRAETFALQVVDPSGAAVRRFAATVLSPDGQFEHARAPCVEHEAGRIELHRPAEPFGVRIVAPGFDLALVGPLDPLRLQDVLPVVLTPLPGLRGHVWSAEGPAAEVEVSLLPLVPPTTRYERNGFQTQVLEAVDTTRSDGEGRFLLTPREPGRYVVRAEREGYAPAVSATLELGSSLAWGEIELELGAGGALEGRVVRLDGVDPSGTIVGLSRGDGHDRTLRVGPEGSYRFERLTPGPWLLVERSEEIRPGNTVSSSSDGGGRARDIDWNVQVHEGRTTRHDLVLGAGQACVLTGRLTLEGRAPVAWQAALVEEDEFFAEGAKDPVSLDPGGNFRITAATPGRYWLVLASGFEGVEQFLLDVVQLEAGVQPWEYDLEVGALEVAGVPSWGGDGPPGFVHVWDGPGSKKSFTILSGDEAGIARVPSVPAGKGRVVRPDTTSLDFERWPTVIAVEVPHGGTGVARLP